MLLGVSLAPSIAGAADEGLSIIKSVSKSSDIGISNVAGINGETFSYTLQYSCNTFAPACTSVTITDTLPLGLEVVAPVPPSWVVGVDGSGATTLQIPVGTLGAGGGDSIAFPVRFTTNTALAANDTETAVNTAHIAGLIGTTSYSADSNAVSATGIVRAIGAATTSKTVTPATVAEFSDAPVAVVINGSNAGTTAASSLVVTDLDADFFAAFDISQIGAPTAIAGATATVEVTADGATWTTVATPHTPAGHLVGVRVTYSGAIAPNTPGSLPFTAVLRDATVGGAQVVIGASQVYTNDVASSVAYPDPTLNKGATGTAAVTVTGEVVNPPTLTKAYSPTANVAAGYSGPITTTVRSVSTGAGGLDSLAISDPPTGGSTPFGTTLLLTGVFSVTAWPAGAEQAMLTVTCPGGATASATTVASAAGPLAAPVPPCGYGAVTGFAVAFTTTSGTPISSTAVAAITADSTVAPGAADSTYYNDAEVDATSSSLNSSNTTTIVNIPFTVATPHAELTTTKSFTRPLVRVGSPTQSNTIQLNTIYGPAGSGTNISVNSVAIQDPQVLPTPGVVDFFDQYDIQSIRSTDCAPGDTLALEYYNGAAWVAVAGDACAMTLPIDMTGFSAQGVRFMYSNATGINPGRAFQPEVLIRARLTDRETGQPVFTVTVPNDTQSSAPNCSAATAILGGQVVAQDSTDVCPHITSQLVGGGPAAVDKRIDTPADPSAREGSHERTSGSVFVSLRPNVATAQMVLQDPVPGDPYSETFASVMDIVAVGPYAVAAYERARVQFLVAGAWTEPAWVTGGGTIPSTPGPAGATSWRLVLEEDPANPGVDPGIEDITWDAVATTGSIRFTYELRDTFRTAVGPHAAGDPVLNNICYTVSSMPMAEDATGVPTGSCTLGAPPFAAAGFNTAAGNPTDAGWIMNDVQGTFTAVSGAVHIATSSFLDDQIFRITNAIVNAQIDKTFSDATVPMPATGQAPGILQQRTVSLLATNTSAGTLVDELRITDTDAGFWSSFELLSASLPVTPAGYTGATYDVTFSDGSPAQAGLTLAALNALPNLPAVNGIVAHVLGNLSATAGTNAARLDLLVRLRASVTTAIVIADTATVQAIDLVASSQPSPDSASIQVRAAGVVVSTTKSITLAAGETAEIDSEPVLSVVLRTTNTGELDLSGIVSEDDDIISSAQYPPGTVLPSNIDGDFWNRTDFVALTSITLPANAESFAVEYFEAAAGTWVAAGAYPAGTPIATVNAALPVAAVEGVRVTYTSTTGDAFHAGEFGEVAFQVKVQDTTPVNVALINCAESAYVDAQGQLNRINPACASFTPLPGQPAVSIDKVFDATGQHDSTDASGTTQHYRITVTNTGTQRIGSHGNVPFAIVDTLAPQLSYNLATASPSITLPTGDSTLVAIPTPIAGAGNVTWTWPYGQYLAPGESVVLRVSLDLAPAIPVGTDVPNTAGVVMPNANYCSSTTPYSGYANGQCQSQAIVKVNSAASIRATKSVQGDGVTTATPGAAVTCPATGFVANPCVAIAPAGTDYTWKLDLLNGGNTSLANVVMIDVLPGLGDTGAALAIGRGSEWRGVPSTAPTAGALPAGVTATFQYLSDASALTACLAEVRLAAGTPCADWITLPAGTVIPAAALALRVLADYGVGGNPLLAPGGSLSVTWDETSPADLAGSSDTWNADGQATPDTRLTEWNSFGYRVVEAASGGVFRNESNKAGVVFDSASLDIAKVVQEDTLLAPADFGTFTVGYSCQPTAAGTAPITGTVVLASGQHATIQGLPTGSVCTLTESAAPESFAWAPADADPQAAGYQIVLATAFATTGATLTNAYASHSLTVTKIVVGTAPAGTTFPFTVSCTWNGTPLTLPAGDAAFSLASGGQHVITGLPVGTRCTALETDTGGADLSTVAVSTGSAPVIDGLSAAATLAPGNAQIDYTNNFGTNGLTVVKAVDGTLDQGYAVGPFTIKVTCLDEVNGTLSQTWTVGAGQPRSMSGISNGTPCTVAETDSGHAHHVQILIDGVPSTTGTFTFGSRTAQTIQIQVVNTYDTGSLSITKELIGEPSVQQWPFEATCTWQGQSVVRTVLVTEAGTPVILTGLPVGASCTVVEASNGQDSVEYSQDGPYLIDEDGTNVEVTATNSYLGELVVTKVVENHTLLTDAQIAALRFEIAVTCLYDGTTVLSDTQLYADGQSETFTDLPVGSLCAVEETGTGGASSTTVTVVPPPTVVDEKAAVPSAAAESAAAESTTVESTTAEAAVAEGETDVIVTNIYSPLSITVTKQLTGSPTEADKAAAFTFSIGCVWDAGDTKVVVDLAAAPGITGGSFTLAAGASLTVAGLPYPSNCAIAETGSGGADSTTYAVDGVATPAATGGPVAAIVALDALSAGADGLIAVTVTNQFDEIPVVVTPPAPGTLAQTGARAVSELQVALVALLAGLGLVLGARRRREQ